MTDLKTQTQKDDDPFRHLTLRPSDTLMEKLRGITKAIPGHVHNYLAVSRAYADTAFRPWLRPHVNHEVTLEWWVLGVEVEFDEVPSGSRIELTYALEVEVERWLGKPNEEWNWSVHSHCAGHRFKWQIEVRDKREAPLPDPIEFVDVLADLEGVPVPTLPDFDFGFETEG